MLRDHQEVLSRLGPEFASKMISALQQEANSRQGAGQAFRHSEPMREALVGLAAQWREAIVLHDLLQQEGTSWGLMLAPPLPPVGFRELK